MHNELKAWLESLGIEAPKLSTMHGDASGRRYYRLEEPKSIVMDASDMKESVPIFLEVNERLVAAKVRTALIKAYDLEKGFILLEDIGATHLFDKVKEGEGSVYYEKAIKTLVQIQETSSEGLDLYDADFLLEEMNLLTQWYLKAHLGKKVECLEGRMLLESFSIISKEVLSQPQGMFVHRDYHSRNLMIDNNEDIVVIDFQDAKNGALTYDLVSLLKDVYVELDEEEIKRLIALFKDLKGINVEDETFMRWFDFTALQRHIKILGIFARLSIRDGKDGYLNDIPLTLKYVLETASKYPELNGLVQILKS